MYVTILVFTCIYIYTHTIYTIRTYVRTYVCMRACMHACMHACMYVCMYVQCICIDTMSAIIYIYIFIHAYHILFLSMYIIHSTNTVYNFTQIVHIYICMYMYIYIYMYVYICIYVFMYIYI